MYKISISKKSIDFLNSLSDKDYLKIRDVIKDLKSVPRPNNCKKLRGMNSYRVRYRDIRVLYLIDDINKTIEIYKISHRKDAYK
jgi:mRNA interferase RelE/StbE